MTSWLGFAVAASILYGLHQIFTKLSANRIGEGIGSLVVESTAAVTILLYLGVLRVEGRWQQPVTPRGVAYATLTGVCVGLGTIAFFLLFQRGGPLSAVPAILAGGAAIMAFFGIVVFREPATPSRLLGIGLALAGLFLMRR